MARVVRYDYEGVAAEGASLMMARMAGMTDMFRIAGGGMAAASAIALAPGFVLSACDDFEYTDPVDGSVSSHQGLRFVFADGSRIVFRLSGTGSVGATVRLYVEKYEADPSKLQMDTAVALAPLVEVALSLSQIKTFTGRTAPTVIT